jgi:hypothetical protein
LYARRKADSKDIEFRPDQPITLKLKAAPGTSAVSPSSYPITVTAASVTVADTAGYYTGTNVETVLAEVGSRYLLGSSTPPADTTMPWLSNRWQDVRPPAGGGDHVLSLSASLGWENGTVQEPQVWYAGGKWHMIYTGAFSPSSALGYAYASSPYGPWTKNATPLIGQGNGGVAGKAYHSGVYVEGSTAYITFTGGTTIELATVVAAAPSTVTNLGTLFTLPSGPTAFGNSQIHKFGSTYYLIYDTNVSNWQAGYATATAVTGTYTNQFTSPWGSLWSTEIGALDGPDGQGGNLHVFLEDTTYVAFYHGGHYQSGSLPTDGYRATKPTTLAGNDWTPAFNGRPYVRRQDRREVDQVADLCPVEDTITGQKYLLWSALDNITPSASIMACALAPNRMVHDGVAWRSTEPASDSGLGSTQPGKSSVVALDVDYTSTSLTYVDFMSVYFRPTGSRCVVDFQSFCAFGTTGAVDFQIVKAAVHFTDTSTVILGKNRWSTAAVQVSVGGKAYFTGLTARALYKFTLQVKVPSSTFFCRPLSAVGESCVMEARDAVNPTPTGP